MKKTNTLLSICTRCRDGREDMHENRGGTRLAEEFMKRATEQIGFNVRGIYCMSQCKRPCVVSFTAADYFTYSFGDIDPECSEHIDALFTFAEMYASAPEGFVLRNDRPEVLRAGILGRYPPIKTASELVSTLSKK